MYTLQVHQSDSDSVVYHPQTVIMRLPSSLCGWTFLLLLLLLLFLSFVNGAERQDSGCSSDEVRLVDGRDEYEGRVEICLNEKWGTVCDDHWGDNDATVVCRQLGFINGSDSEGGYAVRSAEFGEGIDPIHLDNVYCNGAESELTECPYDSHTSDCSHYEDAGVICPGACSYGSIRLVNGRNPYEGRVEICLNEKWGTVCDDLWDDNDATVVCRQLGFINGSDSEGGYAVRSAEFGEGIGPIHLVNVYCNGAESGLTDCPYNSYTRYCSHYKDAGVICPACSDGSIRLADGRHQYEGRVEICLYEKWGTVCDNYWGDKDATVVCRQLGFINGSDSRGGYAVIRAEFGKGIGPIHLVNVRCNGTESGLTECPYYSYTSDCSHYEDAGVICPACSNNNIRLADGRHQYEGRVEICLNKQWGTVCGDEWDDSDATVVCRQLGFTLGGTAKFHNCQNAGSSPVWMNNVSCSGHESFLIDCTYYEREYDCSSYAEVFCNQASTDVIIPTFRSDSKFLQASPGVAVDPQLHQSATIGIAMGTVCVILLIAVICLVIVLVIIIVRKKSVKEYGHSHHQSDAANNSVCNESQFGSAAGDTAEQQSVDYSTVLNNPLYSATTPTCTEVTDTDRYPALHKHMQHTEPQAHEIVEPYIPGAGKTPHESNMDESDYSHLQHHM